MQASIPSFIQTVRIGDLSQGNHPIRIISIRTLAEDEKPGDESANQADAAADPNEQKQDRSDDGLLVGLKKDTSDPFVRGDSPGPGQERPLPEIKEKDQQEQTEELGKSVNLEVAFAYRSLPVHGKKVYSKAKNAHLEIDFGLGLPGIFGGVFRQYKPKSQKTWN
jgi:Ca2+-dependent lipid-binding protein